MELSGSRSIAGSTTVLHIAQECANLFMEQHLNVDISVAGGGSGARVKSAGSGEVDSGEASRNIKASELLSYQDLVAFSVTKDSDPRACYMLINGDTEIEVEFRRVEYPVRSVADEIGKRGSQRVSPTPFSQAA